MEESRRDGAMLALARREERVLKWAVAFGLLLIVALFVGALLNPGPPPEDHPNRCNPDFSAGGCDPQPNPLFE